MVHRKEKSGNRHRSHTLPSSPTHSFSSSSSSDFEFTISLSPRKSSAHADELFYKGKLLPLQLSPRISLVRTLLSSSSTSSSSNYTDPRHSSDSHSSFSTDTCCDSSRPSSVTDADLLPIHHPPPIPIKKPPNKYFSLSRFSSVFRKEPKSTTTRIPDPDNITSVKKISLTAKDVIRRYFKKAKPLYEKLSQKTTNKSEVISVKSNDTRENTVISHSFSGNLRFPRKKVSIISSCPSSMRSSPSRNGVVKGMSYSSETSSMEELQSAIQGAIAHCKNSMSTLK